ncbi:hypothetical protein AS156_29480 [Bradyrhizobium macuxiense]|uniref:Uncharacterized protein n=1 Tax=Bradyrhizobium macuxiense TaxID=1755647 RepID=A0A109K3X6_9BRAD|nr:hypothetical protein AS156_29480 [Bradyrhizobium macuxiense]
MRLIVALTVAPHMVLPPSEPQRQERTATTTAAATTTLTAATSARVSILMDIGTDEIDRARTAVR